MRRRGYVFIDGLVGLALLAGVAGLTVAGEAGYNRLAHRLADQQAALRTAEQGLAILRTGGTVPEALHATITRLDTPAPAGMQWVRVESIVNNRRAELVGLVGARP